jgi:hypothetical protein
MDAKKMAFILLLTRLTATSTNSLIIGEIMKIFRILQIAFVTILTAGGAATHADEKGENIIYFGAGSTNSGNSPKVSSRPMSLGYLRIANANTFILGFDISGEGVMLESTWGQNNTASQANSYNFLIGGNIKKDEDYRVDAALLVGVRESFSSCPSSYLGYQCYADKPPEKGHALNYGALLSFTYRSVVFGVRVTGESKQALVGIRF